MTDPKIIGFWKVVNGDYPLTNEYRADGTFVQRVDSTVCRPHRFKIEGEHLHSFVEQSDGSIIEQRTRFVLSDDTLTFLHSPGRKIIFRRVQPAY